MSAARDSIDWIPDGSRFTAGDIVHYQGSDAASFEEVAGRFDLILTSPHGTAALPHELRGWLDPGVDKRMQYDFSDVTTSALCQAWANADERVVYIENPHPRVLFDPNRRHPDDAGAALREFFARYRQRTADHEVALGGVDAVRPFTFSGAPFLREPSDSGEWGELVRLLESLSERGSKVYRETRDDVIEQVYCAKARRLSELDLRTVGHLDFASSRTLVVVNVHDTMNTTIRADGAVITPRPPADRLPTLVSLGNRGDRFGQPRSPDNGELLDRADVPTMSAPHLQSLRRAIQLSFGIADHDVEGALELNKPYLGAYEVQRIGRQLRALDERGPVRHVSGEGLITMRSGAVQAEFRRERLLGEMHTAEVQAPGTGWPDPDLDHVAGLAGQLVEAFDMLRRWNHDVPVVTPRTDPRYR